tara:strand:- start:96734 stop:96904 length:171 start_codon:yes stop_codon:yes gene_type:complete
MDKYDPSLGYLAEAFNNRALDISLCFKGRINDACPFVVLINKQSSAQNKLGPKPNG